MKNKLIQKIISTILLIILMLQFICPNISLASSEFGYSKYKKNDDNTAEDANYLAENLDQGTEDNNIGMDVEKEEGGEEYSEGLDLSSPSSGIIDTYSGIILTPTVVFLTFVVDSVMSVFSSVMTQKDLQFVMVTEEELSKLGPAQETENIRVVPISITDMKALFATASGDLTFIRYPYFTYSPEEIFAGKLDLLDVNFIDDTNQNEDWINIRKVVSQWYQILRMIAIIGLLSVLIYTGIRIILSSNAKDKAKYKELIVNWFIGVILVFSMHYIMAFILSVIEEITNRLHGLTGAIQVNANGVSFVTNLIGLARFQIQQQHFTAKIGHLIIYVALVTYTFKFTFLYLKRVLRMAFLTLIAPIVALTYPIDKANDGKAQGFDMWLKEFTFNALLQPVHYILYYILVSSSLTLSARNPIYGIAALMFISQAEKILKKIFGFDKARAGTVGGIAGAFATGAVTSSLIKHARNPLHPFGGGSESSKPSKDLSSNESNNFNLDENEIDFNEDTTDMGELLNTNLRGARNGRTTLPGVDDSIYRYRQTLPKSVEDLGGLHFDDGNPNSLDKILKMINNKQFKLESGNLSPKESLKLENELLGLEGVLQNRVIQNERNFGGNLQYTDKYNKMGTMDLINEIRRLNKEARNPHLSEKERKDNAIKASRLLKTVKRRMAQNQYMERNGALQSLRQSNGPQPNGQQPNGQQPNGPQQNTPQQNGAQPNGPQQNAQQQNAPAQQQSAWKEFKQKHPTARGLVKVGKNILKPAWDMEKDAKYNGKRLTGNILKGVAGATVGIATAAVQAGISITDGKYNQMEGFASVGAGIAGVSSIGKRIENREPINLEDRRSLEKYKEQWFNSDSVINSYNLAYGGQGKDMRARAVKNYVSRGITDVNEQKKAIKFAEMIKKERGLDEDEADKVAVATLQYRQRLIKNDNYSVLYDKKQRKKHIDLNVDAYTGSASKDSVRRVHEDLIENVRDFDRANR